ncbi:MAG: PilZ domain-containing protein [Desulforhopalus sp.]
MLSKYSSQRRKSVRAEISWPVTVISEQSALQGLVKNLSRGGALLYLQEKIDLYEKVRIAIEVPEYNDVVSTAGEVVRISPLTDTTEEFAYALGIKFDSFPEESLKYLTGNLAAEWQKDYKEPEPVSPPGYGFLKNLIYGVLSILFFFLVFYAVRSYNADTIDPGRVAALESELGKLESQLKTLQEESASERSLREQLFNMQTELTDLKNSVVLETKVEQLQLRVKTNTAQIADLTARLTGEPVRQPKSTAPAANATEKPVKDSGPEQTVSSSAAVYHVVKKGENLYRIALKYSLDAQKILELNNLPPDFIIYPNQKLLVQ